MPALPAVHTQKESLQLACLVGGELEHVLRHLVCVAHRHQVARLAVANLTIDLNRDVLVCDLDWVRWLDMGSSLRTWKGIPPAR